MSRLEDRLRAAFRADADTVTPDSVAPYARQPGKRAARRTRLLLPVAAGIAVAAIAAGVWAASPVSPDRALRPGTAPSAQQQTPDQGPIPGSLPMPVIGQQAPRAVASSAAAPGVPPFFVAAEPDNVPHQDDLVVQDTATGKITGILVPPNGTFFPSVAATSGDRTFVTAVMPHDGQPCLDQLYQFQLNSSGQPGPLVPLNVTLPGNFNENDTLAVTPDGRPIAYSTYVCGEGTSEFGVIDLTTRHVRVWSAGEGAAGFASGLTLSADGRLLAFAEQGAPRILTTDASPGPILARSRILSSPGADWVALAGDGSTFYGCTLSISRFKADSSTLTYYRQTVGSAQRQVIASWHNLNNSECMATLDPSGSYLLMQFPSISSDEQPAILDLRTGTMTSIPAPPYYGPLTVAW